jgi:hypothetical protein
MEKRLHEKSKYQFLRLIKTSSGQAIQFKWHESPKKGKQYISSIMLVVGL